MVVSIGAIASSAQGVSYYERDGYYAKDDPDHREASAWAGKGAAALHLAGSVDPETFQGILEGQVPNGPRLGRPEKDGTITHRPGRDVTFSAPKSVSLAALVGGDPRITVAHDRAVMRALDWIERNAIETRMKDPETGRMVRAGGQKMVSATFRHDTSRNLDPQLHTHAVIANMVQGADDRWRTMANERLYASKMLIGSLYRSELAHELGNLGYAIKKTHADGRFEIAGVPRAAVEAFSTRRAEIEAAMAGCEPGYPAASQRLAERAALMTRSYKREVDKEALRESWRRQAVKLGLTAEKMNALVLERPVRETQGAARGHVAGETKIDRTAADGLLADTEDENRVRQGPRENERAFVATEWAMAHLSEREAVFPRTDLLAAALAWQPGAVTIEAAERAVVTLEEQGRLHRAPALGNGDGMTTDRALADERETISLMRAGSDRGQIVMRSWMAQARLHNGPLTAGQRHAVKLILSSKDRVVGVQGYAGTGKTTMLNRARVLAAKRSYRMMGLAPSASAVRTLSSEAGIESETLQRFLARNAGVIEGRLTTKGERKMRAAYRKTVLVVDEGSLASTVQARDLLRITNALRIPRVVLVGDEKQLDAVDAGRPFAQLQRAGMKTAVMDEILRQRDPDLKAAVEASLAGDVRKAFEKLGPNVAEVKADNIAGAVAARWLKLSSETRESTGVMAPSHALRRAINEHIRDRLARDGVIHGPRFEGVRLVSYGYTSAERSLATSYVPGDVVAFHRPYKRLGVEKGDERRVAAVDREGRTVMLEGRDGETVPWQPGRLAGCVGGAEVYRAEGVELRAGDRIRWTRNDRDLGLVNSREAEVVGVQGEQISFRLEGGRVLELTRSDRQLRHLDHAWASTVHAFQGRTVDNVIAAMEANHPHLTTQKSFYVEISRARDWAELVTDDAARLREQLEAATGERLSALESIGEKGPVEPTTLDGMTTRDRDSPVERNERPSRDIGPKEEGLGENVERAMSL